MIAKISPSSTANERSWTAARPPKLRPSLSALRTGSGCAACRGVAARRVGPCPLACAAGQAPEEAQEAARHEEDRDAEDDAVGDEVAVGERALQGLLDAGED